MTTPMRPRLRFSDNTIVIDPSIPQRRGPRGEPVDGGAWVRYPQCHLLPATCKLSLVIPCSVGRSYEVGLPLI